MDKATWWGAVINLVLAVAKLIVGYIGHSQALIADGLHSLSDLISDGVVLMATQHASYDADEDHPYGHARFETLGTIILGVLLIAVAVGIGFDASKRIISQETMAVPATITLWIAAVSILSKELLYHYTVFVARKVNSKLLAANAWHHRSDAVSSVVVFIGIGAAMMGWPILDSIAAIIVALMIARIGWELSYHSVQELVDRALEPEIVEQIKETISQVDGVKALHMLRTRRMGQNALVDVHILVNSKLSVSEGHQISEAVEYGLINRFEDINDVTVHIDPEDDEEAPNSCKHLPLRSDITAELKAHWQDIPEAEHILDITLHYLDGKVNVDVVLPLDVLTNYDTAEAVKQKLVTAIKPVEYIRTLSVHFT